MKKNEAGFPSTSAGFTRLPQLAKAKEPVRLMIAHRS